MATNLIQYGTFQLSSAFPNLVTNGDFTDWNDGPELVTDSGFDDSAEWTAGGTWVVDDSGDSLATVTGDGTEQILSQAHAAVESYQNYEITYEVTVNTLLGDSYLTALYAGQGKPYWKIFLAHVRRIGALFKSQYWLNPIQ